MDEGTRLIDLYGHTRSILYKNDYIMVVLFADEYHGKVVVSIPCEHILYHNRLDRNKTYHLQVELKGKTKVIPNGTSFTRNSLIVKRAEVI